MPACMALCTREAGKTLADGIAEVREAVDFLRYYAGQARAMFGAPEQMPGPTGESNTLQLGGRGVFACISPWNFPLATRSQERCAGKECVSTGNCRWATIPSNKTPTLMSNYVTDIKNII